MEARRIPSFNLYPIAIAPLELVRLTSSCHARGGRVIERGEPIWGLVDKMQWLYH